MSHRSAQSACTALSAGTFNFNNDPVSGAPSMNLRVTKEKGITVSKPNHTPTPHPRHASVTRPLALPTKKSARLFARTFAQLTVACALYTLLAVPASVSAAVPARPFLETFGSLQQPTFTEPASLAVDGSGDVYVADLATQTVSRFKPNGEPDPFSALSGSNVIDGASGADEVPGIEEILTTESGSDFEAEISVAPSGSASGTAGDIYVTNAERGQVDIFESTGKYLGETSSKFPCGVSVGPEGDVYVGDYYDGIRKLEPAAPGNLSEVAKFMTTTPCQVAAGYGPSAGSVFVSEYGGKVTKLNASTGTEEYEVFGGLSKGGISVDPTTGDLYVGNELTVKEFDASGAAPKEVSSTPLSTTVTASAAGGAGDDLYVARANDTNLEVLGPVPAESLLTVGVAGDGEGTVEGGDVAEPSTIECGTGGSECEHTYGDELVTLKGVAVGGHTKPVVWEGCDAVNGSNECEVTMSEAKTVKASFVLDTNALTLAHTGEGTLTAECKNGVSYEACASPLSELPYGTEVKVTGTPTLGWLVESVQGTGSALGCSSLPCEFTVTQDSAVSVTYAASGAEFADLTVYEGGNGTGTVQSTPSGVDCGPACTGLFEAGQMVTLKATASTPGSIFEGWSGNCAPTSATECEIEIKTGGTAVTASFAAVPVVTTEPAGANCQYGGIKVEYAGSTYYTCNGLVGANGKTTVIGTATAGECPQGGITIETVGEPASKKAICNGQQGLSGQIGFPGEQGPAGQTGISGQNGLQGPAGPTGATGAPGTPGAPGVQGKQGPAGKVTVTCKLTHAKKITCTVKQANANSSSLSTHQDLYWSLHRRGGRLINRGDTSLQHLQHVLNHLPHGHYLLHINGQQHSTKITVN
jgi:Collagen triple helix repeat (20 copies)/Divergent InlB B-repeat domain